MKTAIVVGSGAGGAMAAKELQGTFEVTVLEEGKEFRPFSMRLTLPEKAKRAGLLFEEKVIHLLFPAMRIEKTSDRMIHVRGIGTGGTTTLATANALRMDHDLQRIGINLDQEFDELSRAIPISTGHQKRWRETTRRLFEISEQMGLHPRAIPKMVDYDLCAGCGRCILGCPTGAKWDSRRFLEEAVARGARLMTGCKVESLIFQNGKASGIRAKIGRRLQIFPADLIVLAAGGLGTPVILQNSGISSEPRLFVDPVLCVASEWKNAFQNKEVPMPFVIQKDRYILSPYFDYLSYFFNKKWKPPAHNILSLMIKLADTNAGSVSGGRIRKALTSEDKVRLNEAVSLCTDILQRFGVKKEDVFLGTINAGHPGGMLPLTSADAGSLHPSALPENVYVADASLFPHSLGNPPILTIMALAKRISRAIRDRHS